MADTTFIPTRYLSRSWAMLTQDKGWWKPILVLALVSFIPIVGQMAVLGYALGWARLTAWGYDSAPKQSHVDVGGVLTTGAKAWVVVFVWSLVSAIVVLILNATVILIPLSFVFLLFITLFETLATIRSAIYGRVGPGLGVPQIWDMATRDFGGLCHMLGISLINVAIQFAIALVVMLVFMVGFLGAMGGLIYASYYGNGELLAHQISQIILSMLPSAFPILFLVGYGSSLINIIFQLLVTNGVALWMRQYDVPHWGSSSDPVPPSVRASALPPAPQLDPEGSEVPVAPAAPAASAAPAARETPANPVVPAAPVGPDAPDALASPTTEEVPAMSDSVDEPVVPPTPEDLYEVAAEKTTEWTDVVSPTPEATFHMAWPEGGETVAPERSDQGGVRPPTPTESYTEVPERVAQTWPDVDLQSKDAVPAMDDAAMAKEVNAAVDDLAKERGEELPSPERPVVRESEAPRAEVAQTPVTPPTPDDLYDTATTETVEWTSVVTPGEPGDGTIAEPEGGETVNPPIPKDDGGVVPPSASELYDDVAQEVAKGWPDVDLQSQDAMASIDNAEVREATDEAIAELKDENGVTTLLEPKDDIE